MRGAEFKRLARQGVKSYGDDPWFFLRELAQNSRDAGARHIRVNVLYDGDREVLAFTDDGRGMGRGHAEQFLFRLYASSKESERSSAGMYGIGFWTVLGFEPDHIEIMSRTETESWALNLDGEFAVHETACKLDGPGTRVVLSRPAASPDRGTFRDEVRSALHRYCRYLRRNDRTSSVLPVDLDGTEINEPLRVGGPAELRFRSGAVEGAVGLADEPRVELYARGLPVWEGMLLEELSHNPPPVQSAAGLETGLSPVFVLNGNDLDVVMDRNAVVDDRALRRLRQQAAKALRRLVRAQLDGLSGRGPFPRLRRIFAQLRSRRWFVPVMGAAVLALVVGTVPLWEGLPEGSPDIGPGKGLPQKGLLPQHKRAPLNDLVSLQQALASYRGAVVEVAPGGDLLPLTFTPPARAWFRLSVAEDFDQRHGFVRPRIPADGPPPVALDCSDACVRVRLPTRGGAAVPLPLPTGWALVPDSLALDGHPLSRPAALNRYGEAVVHLPADGGILTWACTPHRSSLGAAATARLLETGDAPLPAAIEDSLRDLDDLPPEDRVVRALALTRSLLSYVEGDGPLAPRPGNRPWADRALALGTGDCDVINGILVIALRRAGIPARLAIGFVGDEGKLRPGLHAWTEFHLGGWQAVDASSASAAIAAEDGEIVEVAPIEDRAVPPYPRPLLVAAPRPLRSLRDPSVPHGGGGVQRANDFGASQGSTTMDTTTPLYSSPAGGSVPKGRGGDGEATNPFAYILLLIAIVSGLAALVLLLGHLRRARTWSRLEGNQSPEAADAVLGRMALSWSVRPDLWGVAGFSLAPLLPRLGGGRISLERAAYLAHRGRLFFGSPDNPLALSPRRSVVVLDGSNPGFAPYLHRIPSATNLDPIHTANPADPSSRQGPVPELLAAVNQILDNLGDRARCLLAPGLGAGALRDVDLTGLGTLNELPPRFIALDPDASFLREAGRLHSEQPILAVYKMIEWISHRSALPRRSPAQLRRGAARLLLDLDGRS